MTDIPEIAAAGDFTFRTSGGKNPVEMTGMGAERDDVRNIAMAIWNTAQNLQSPLLHKAALEGDKNPLVSALKRYPGALKDNGIG